MRPQTLDIGSACNNACLFCAEPSVRARSELAALKLRKMIAAARERRATELWFTGGEPALRPELPELARYAKSLGFEKIGVQTNARLYCYPGKAQEAVEAGLTHFETFVHGHAAALHEHLTGTVGSFVQALAGVKKLVAAGAEVTGGVVMVRPNYRHLAEIVKLLAELGARSVRFYAASLPPSAMTEKAGLVPRMSLLAPYLKNACQAARRAGLSVGVEGVPPCQFSAPMAGAGPETAYPCAWTPGTPPKLGPPCADCAHFATCAGPSEGYTKRFGWDEFKPILTQAAP